MHISRLSPMFVKSIPKTLQPGILYVSKEYGMATHSCCCGCGMEVVTPLTPTEWKLTLMGNTVSLWPSIGNWNLPCRSHYFIRNSKVVEAGPWDEQRIKRASQLQRAARAAYFAQSSDMDSSQPKAEPKPTQTQRPPTESIWSKIWRWIVGSK